MTAESTPQLRYNQHLHEPNDIRDHLPRLFEAARGTVLELGVRGGVSTSAFLAGIETHGGELWSIDIDPTCETVFAGHPAWHFVCADSRNRAAVETAGLRPPIDVLFIDTLHTYEQVRDELRVWMPAVRTGGTVFLHDTETFIEVRNAIADYAARQGLSAEFHGGSNGLGILHALKATPPAGRLTRASIICRYWYRRFRNGYRERRSAFFGQHPQLKHALARLVRHDTT